MGREQAGPLMPGIGDIDDAGQDPDDDQSEDQYAHQGPFSQGRIRIDIAGGTGGGPARLGDAEAKQAARRQQGGELRILLAEPAIIRGKQGYPGGTQQAQAQSQGFPRYFEVVNTPTQQE